MNQEPTHEEKVHIANASAQLEVIKANIRIVNKELSILLKNKEDVIAETIDIKEELKVLKVQKAEAFSHIEEYRNVLERMERTSEATLEDLKDATADVLKRKTTLEKEERIFMESISDKKITLAKMEASISDTEENLIETNLESLKASLELEEKQKELATLNKEITHVNAEYEVSKSNLEQFNSEANKLMEEATAKIEAEKAKVYNPLKALHEEELKLEKKRRNIDILEVRMRDRIKAVFPQQEVKL